MEKLKEKLYKLKHEDSLKLKNDFEIHRIYQVFILLQHQEHFSEPHLIDAVEGMHNIHHIINYISSDNEKKA